MKKYYIILFSVLCSSIFSQTFEGSTGSINSTGQETTFTLHADGFSTNLNSGFGLESMYLQLSHPDVSQLHLLLISPSGIKIDLIGLSSCTGNNFGGTTFKNGFTSITIGTAPFTGTFAPVGNFGRFNNNLTGNGDWKLVVKDFVIDNSVGTVDNWKLIFGSSPAQPVVFESSNLLILTIDTQNQTLSEDQDILVNLGITDNGGGRNNLTDARNNYNGKAACHIRGSSSSLFEKKSLKIELRDAGGVNQNHVSLLGMPAESDWALIPGYTDKTLIRQALAQFMFQQMGRYSPRFRYVEVVLNGEYFGVYLLMEHIKRGKDRVNIQKMENLDNQFPYITGGYILQIDRNNVPGWYSRYPGISAGPEQFYYQYIYPKPDVISTYQQNYIKAVLDSFETAMQSPGFTDPSVGYKRYIDEFSFIDMFILNEYSKNVDGYRLSTYLYKDNIMDGGKLHAGPAWDYDLAWHNCQCGNTYDPSYWQYPVPSSPFPAPTWWKRLLEDPTYNDKLYCRYHTLRISNLSNDRILQFINNTASLLSEAQERNFRQFPVMGARIFANPQDQSTATYQSEVQDLKNWITSRGAWLDSNIPGFCSDIGIAVNGEELKGISSFPNPFGERIHLKCEKSGRLEARLTNSAGVLVMKSMFEEDAANHEIILNTASLEPGVYILSVSNAGKIYHNKMIKFKE